MTEMLLGDYLDRHHWFFGFIVIGYIFYLHDTGLHVRFDALDKRLDEIRKRLACGSRPPAVHMMRALRQCKEACE